MTLLDTLVALLILGLAGVGMLEIFQGTSRSARATEAWVEAVAEAEALMEETKLGAPPATRPGRAGPPARVDVQPWPEMPELNLVTVTVPLPGAGALVLRRLVRAR